ncbi:hypothetical protein LZ31DRAFT_553914 [Colletotrichum somersetense]|nr:hypothetical protein LZ31DRAFT_553914 [Colletotrichum somersetense]
MQRCGRTESTQPPFSVLLTDIPNAFPARLRHYGNESTTLRDEPVSILMSSSVRHAPLPKRGAEPRSRRGLIAVRGVLFLLWTKTFPYLDGSLFLFLPQSSQTEEQFTRQLVPHRVARYTTIALRQPAQGPGCKVHVQLSRYYASSPGQPTQCA